MTIQNYIKAVAETALANGLTPEQIINNPEAAAKAYLYAQFKSLEEAKNNILNNQEKYLN